jgi:hypothetical protein
MPRQRLRICNSGGAEIQDLQLFKRLERLKGAIAPLKTPALLQNHLFKR